MYLVLSLKYSDICLTANILPIFGDNNLFFLVPMCVTFAVFLYGEAEDSCSVCRITRVAGHHRDGSLLSLVAFRTNQDFIAANLCVNRDRPELECNGKCQLIKTLEEQQPSGQPKAVPANDLIIPLFHTAYQNVSPLVDEAVCEYLTIMISVPAVPYKETAIPPS